MLRIEPLDLQIRRLLLDQILAGTIAPGTNLNEPTIAADLGVSRTPLRQAFVRLQQDGFLQLRPRRGFFVAPLSASEAAEIYPILAALESTALRAGAPTAAQIGELRRLNHRLAALPPDTPDAAVAVNLEWHDKLLERCDNRRLMQLVRTFRQQAYRYEVAFFSPGAVRLEKSVQLHEGMIEALEGDDIEEACRRLEAHWLADLDEIVPLTSADAGRRA